MPQQLNVLDDAPARLNVRGQGAFDAGGCACPMCGNLTYQGPNDGPVAFLPPTDGTAGNGLPIFDWDQVAAQLTRHGGTWSFTPGGAVVVTYAYRADPPGTMPSGTSEFSQFNAEQIAFTEMIFSLWADVANITFVRITDEGSEYSNAASILLGNYGAGAEGASAFAYYPWPSGTAPEDWAGDIWINNSLDFNASLAWGAYGPHTIAHELGHALGLAHPADYDALSGEEVVYPDSSDYWQDSRAYTVMSYFGSAGVGHSLNAFAYGPQLHDIAGLQLLYGANMTTRTGDTVYGFNSNTGLLNYSLTGASDSPVFSIWDAGGNDTIDLSGYFSNSEIDLREQAFSSAGPGNGGVGVAIGNISIARGAVIENAIGGAGADTITGNAVANLLEGRNGADTINAGAGADTLDGGDGADALDGGDDSDFVDGGNDNDTLNGGAGADLLYGRAGLDVLDGGAGADSMYGGGGDDTYHVDNAADVVGENSGAGVDTVIAWANYSLSAYVENLTIGGTDPINGAGNILANVLTGNSAANVLSGLAGADTIYGGDGGDVLNGGNGNDIAFGGDGADTLDGGNDVDELAGEAGNDVLYGRAGGDSLWGHADSDTIYGGDGSDSLFGGDGDDALDGGNGFDQLSGDAGADTLYGRQDQDSLSGGAGNDTLYGGDGADNIVGGLDNDLLDGGNDNDTLQGGDGVDDLYGRLGNDNLNGDSGADALYGGDGEDALDGGADADYLDGGAHADNLYGGAGDDTLYGRQDNDNLYGEDGADQLYGGDGADQLDGGAGADVIDAGNGDDFIDGGAGADTLIGGAGLDFFEFNNAIGVDIDTIIGFSVADDAIILSTSVFTGIAASSWLDANAFVIGSAAADADDRIIYDPTTGALYYDADGNGAGAAIQFASLAPGLTLTANDFFGGP